MHKILKQNLINLIRTNIYNTEEIIYSLPWQSFLFSLYPERHSQEYEEAVLTHFELAGQECFFSKHSSTSISMANENKQETMRRIFEAVYSNFLYSFR